LLILLFGGMSWLMSVVSGYVNVAMLRVSVSRVNVRNPLRNVRNPLRSVLHRKKQSHQQLSKTFWTRTIPSGVETFLLFFQMKILMITAVV
jgi:hypothetical protein